MPICPRCKVDCSDIQKRDYILEHGKKLGIEKVRLACDLIFLLGDGKSIAFKTYDEAVAWVKSKNKGG